MLTLKVCFVFNKIAQNSPIRQIHTHTTLLTRRRNSPSAKNPDLQLNKGAFENEEELLHLEDEECEEIDISQAHLAYDEHISEKKRIRKKIEHKIIERSFFKQSVQPQMLTFAEREYMKYLHNEDPIQWNITALSESFPVTPDAVRKILKSKRTPTLKEQEKVAKNVQRNWQLLAEGKLKAAPEVIQHVKKFINRRDTLLEHIKSKNFVLPEVKNEPVWNNGEMNNILAHYEKTIQELEEKQLNESKALTDGFESDKSMQLITNENEKSSSDIINEKINEKKSVKNLEGKETFLLEKMVRTYSQPVTLEELENNIVKKKDSNEPLNVYEKAILESKLHKKREKNFYNSSNSVKELEETRDSKLSSKTGILNKQKNKRLQQKLFDKETSVKVETVEEDYESENEENFSKFKGKKIFMSEEEKIYIPEPDERTRLISPLEIGKVLNTEDKQNVSLVKTEIVNEKVTKPVELDPEREKRDKLFFEKEEQDIKGTAFWNSDSTSREKILVESQKVPIRGPKDIDKVTRADLSSNDSYPEKIIIPKSKRGSGLTFKVNDCYYDDDGQFLYRVPGMTG